MNVIYTKIDSRLWSDEAFIALSGDAKLLFIYILTSKHRNLLGFYPLPIPYGAYDLGWENKRFIKGLDELLEKGLITYNFKTDIVFIKNFLKYNPLENPNQVKGAMKALDIIPTNAINIELIDYLETVDKGFIKPLIELLRKGLGKQEEEEEEEEEEEVKEDEEERILEKQTPIKKIYGEFSKVKLLDEEYDKLLEKLGKDISDDLIVRLDSYKASTGKTYKSDYATILNWSRKEPIKKADKTKGSSNPFLEMMQDEIDKGVM